MDVVQQVSNTGLNSFGGMVALECLSQGIDGEVDQKIERFLVESRKVRSTHPCWLKYWRKFVRLYGCSTEVRSEEPIRANWQQLVWDDMTTHCHDNEYGDPEEQKPIGGAPDVAGERREDNQDGMRQGVEKWREAQCGAKHGGRWLTSSRQKWCKRNGSSLSGAVKRVDAQRPMTNSASRLTWKTLDPEEGKEKHEEYFYCLERKNKGTTARRARGTSRKESGRAGQTSEKRKTWSEKEICGMVVENLRELGTQRWQKRSASREIIWSQRERRVKSGRRRHHQGWEWVRWRVCASRKRTCGYTRKATSRQKWWSAQHCTRVNIEKMMRTYWGINTKERTCRECACYAGDKPAGSALTTDQTCEQQKIHEERCVQPPEQPKTFGTAAELTKSGEAGVTSNHAWLEKSCWPPELPCKTRRKVSEFQQLRTREKRTQRVREDGHPRPRESCECEEDHGDIEIVTPMSIMTETSSGEAVKSIDISQCRHGLVNSHLLRLLSQGKCLNVEANLLKLKDTCGAEFDHKRIRRARKGWRNDHLRILNMNLLEWFRKKSGRVKEWAKTRLKERREYIETLVTNFGDSGHRRNYFNGMQDNVQTVCHKSTKSL